MGRRRLVAAFDGGQLTSDGGLPLLYAVERRRRIIERFAQCFEDHRDPELIEHQLKELLGQRVYALVSGYEDLNDHDALRRDPLLASVVGKADPTGNDRRQDRDRGKPLAGKSSLHRLEWGLQGQAAGDRYRRIAVNPEAMDRFFVEVFVDGHEQAPDQVVLDFDATDDPLHGAQEGRFFHGYYGGYCYLPLYVFCGSHLLCARLRRSNLDAAQGSVEELERIVTQLRAHWPAVKIVVRGDSGFAREALMSWCELHDVDYIFGLARNPRLEAALEPAFERAEDLCAESEQPERVFAEFSYRTKDSWSRSRRVIGKAEVTWRGPNPRFIVTSLAGDPAHLYEKIYCARGNMENRIKEQQLFLFADRTSAHLMRVNQVRLWMSSVAYLMLNELRRLALVGTELASAQCDTLRLKLIKIGARVRVSVRRIVVSLATGHPSQEIFTQAWQRLARAGPCRI